MTRLKFDTFGNPRRFGAPAYAIRRDHNESSIEAAARSIANYNRLAVASLRRDVTEINRHGQVLSEHWEVTLGRRMTGGYAVSGRLFIAIDTPAKHAPAGP